MADFSENPFASPQATPVKEPPHQSPGSFIPLAAKSKPKTPTAPTTTIEIAEPTVHSSDQKKLQELQLKEEALAKREAELKAKEVQLPIVRPNNFPPLPPCCPIQPCCYVNLTEQIPPAELWKMRVLTILLIYYWGLLIFNFICAIAGVIGHSSSSYDYGTTLGISIAYVILCAPAALFCWWYPVYRGYKKPAKGKSVTLSSPDSWGDPPKYEHHSSKSGRSAKEEELAKREAALREREQNTAKVEGGVHPNNFPPLPPCCPIKPCCYVNLTEQIPASELWKIRLLTAVLIYYWVLLVYNFICTVAGLVVNASDSTYGTTMGVCIAYLLLFVPCSLFCWWYPAYYAYKNNSSLGFLWFFLVMSIQTIGFGINALGIPNLGAAGFINAVGIYKSSNPVGAMFIICGVLWLIPIPFNAVLIFLMHRYYRSSGKSINEATQEAMTGAAKNKYVQQAAVGAAKEGIKASVTGATS